MKIHKPYMTPELDFQKGNFRFECKKYCLNVCAASNKKPASTSSAGKNLELLNEATNLQQETSNQQPD